MHSLMNDKQLKDFGIIIIAEPHAWMLNGRLLTAHKDTDIGPDFFPLRAKTEDGPYGVCYGSDEILKQNKYQSIHPI